MGGETRQLAVNGVRLHVRVEGEGEPVVMLHGFPDSSALWREVTPALVEAGYQVIAPDLRGFGQSEAPVELGGYALDNLARDVLGVMDALGVHRAKLVGHDWGAALGWVLAGNHPERFERYCALSVGHPRGYLKSGLSQKLKAWYVVVFQLRGLTEALIRFDDWRLLRGLTGNHGEVSRWTADLGRPGRLKAALAIYRANFFSQILQGAPMQDATIPVMGVWSSGDRFLSESQMQASRDYVRAPFRYERLDGVGHWIPIEAPAALSALLLDFL